MTFITIPPARAGTRSPSGIAVLRLPHGLRPCRVTHIVLDPEQLGLSCHWEQIYRDDSYAAYRLPKS